MREPDHESRDSLSSAENLMVVVEGRVYGLGFRPWGMEWHGIGLQRLYLGVRVFSWYTQSFVASSSIIGA